MRTHMPCCEVATHPRHSRADLVVHHVPFDTHFLDSLANHVAGEPVRNRECAPVQLQQPLVPPPVYTQELRFLLSARQISVAISRGTRVAAAASTWMICVSVAADDSFSFFPPRVHVVGFGIKGIRRDDLGLEPLFHF